MAMTIDSMASKIDALAAAVEKMSKPNPGGGLQPGQIFARFEPRGSREWPVDKLREISKQYNNDTVTNWMAKDHRRGIGWGNALVKMAAMSYRNLGLPVPETYGQEQFEKEYGFTSMQMARERGIKQLSGEVRKTALAESSGLTGGYIVPPQFLNELNTIAGEQEFIRPRAKVVPMASRTFQMPMLDITTVQTLGTTPYAGAVVASWQPEAASINETEPQFRQGEWTAWDLVLYSVSTMQLLADNGIGLDSLLTQLFGWAMPWYQEYAFLQGRGAGNSMPLGLLNAPASILVIRNTAGKNFKLSDAAAMMSHLQIGSWDSACWMMHQSVLPQLIQMADTTSTTTNHLVWLNPVMPGATGPAANKMPTAFFNGLPIYWTEKLPALGTTGDVMLADWSRYVIGDRMDLQIDVSKDFLFRNNELAWRVVCRLDGRPWLNSFITDAAGWQVSPFVVLSS